MASRIPSSLSLRAVRGALRPLPRRRAPGWVRPCPDSSFGCEGCEAILRRHVSARTMAGSAAGSRLGEARFRNASADHGAPHENFRDAHRRPHLGWTPRHAISSSAALLDDANDNLHGGDDEIDPPDEEEEDGGASIPSRRSRRSKPRAASGAFESSSDLDERARAKLSALSRAKVDAAEAEAAFVHSDLGRSALLSSYDRVSEADLHARWRASEEELARAYAQAIKYVARMPRSEGATRTAEGLLEEWTGRFLGTFDDDDASGEGSAEEAKAKAEPARLGKKRTVRTIHDVMRRLGAPRESAPDDEEGDDAPSSSPSSKFPKLRIPPPSAKDYVNLLRAYATSKAKRKGQACEALMNDMMGVAETIASHYDEHGGGDGDDDVGTETVTWGDGTSETERWRLWATECVPDSKAFSLAIKCHAGTTHTDALERVVALNDIHDSFSECCPWMRRDDPYVLFNSIKALKNLERSGERRRGHLWLRKLHDFVTNPENADYFERRGEGGGAGGSERSPERRPEGSDEAIDAETTSSREATTAVPPTIDVTSAYTTFLRLLARLRGTKGAAAEALSVLDRMHRVHHIVENGLPHPEERSESEPSGGASARRRSIASIEIRANAYNLVLGLYRDSKKTDDAINAIELLKRMIDAGNLAPEDRSGVPLPTEQSFEFTILSLANMSNGENAIQEAERLIQLMQDQSGLESSVSAYNAYITICNKLLSGAPLYDKVVAILDEMNELAETNPGATPNPETLELVMKGCSMSGHDDREKVLATVSKLFSQLEEREPSEKSNEALTDRAYLCMMRCVDAHAIDDSDEKKDRIEGLFSEACQRGLVSAKVLEVFRDAVSQEEFKLTVGEGRLADHWIANIKGPRALYTDGSSGGAGKNARRKGKSTSDWAKKQRAKESKMVNRRKEKQAKKFIKKMKMSQ